MSETGLFAVVRRLRDAQVPLIGKHSVERLGWHRWEATQRTLDLLRAARAYGGIRRHRVNHYRGSSRVASYWPGTVPA